MEKRHGTGMITWPSGVSYEGDWFDNKIEGHGFLTYGNSDKRVKYIGAFKDNKFNGSGTMIYKSGR